MVTPYLVRFATAQAPAEAGLHERCEYDHHRDLLVVKDSRCAAVLDRALRPLMTKKKDIEKGEDQKDAWM